MYSQAAWRCSDAANPASDRQQRIKIKLSSWLLSCTGSDAGSCALVTSVGLLIVLLEFAANPCVSLGQSKHGTENLAVQMHHICAKAEAAIDTKDSV